MIESELSKGSNFYFYIKVEIVELEDEKSSDEESENAEEISFEGKRVLVAEDNKTNQMLIRLLLEDFDIDVTIAEDGVEAVEMVEKSSYDIIFMDENMPNKNGIEAMKEIKQSDEIINIIALTANSVSGDREKFLAEGFDNYISKPIDHDELSELLKSYL